MEDAGRKQNHGLNKNERIITLGVISDIHSIDVLARGIEFHRNVILGCAEKKSSCESLITVT